MPNQLVVKNVPRFDTDFTTGGLRVIRWGAPLTVAVVRRMTWA